MQLMFATTPANPADYLPFVPPMFPNQNVERVNRGIALMDQKYPHWWRVLDLETLDLRSTENCVLGQVAGDYRDGLVTLFGSWENSFAYQSAIDHGFDATSWPDTDHVQALWAHEAGERQATLLESNREGN